MIHFIIHKLINYPIDERFRCKVIRQKTTRLFVRTIRLAFIINFFVKIILDFRFFCRQLTACIPIQ